MAAQIVARVAGRPRCVMMVMLRGGTAVNISGGRRHRAAAGLMGPMTTAPGVSAKGCHRPLSSSESCQSTSRHSMRAFECQIVLFCCLSSCVCLSCSALQPSHHALHADAVLLAQLQRGRSADVNPAGVACQHLIIACNIDSFTPRTNMCTPYAQTAAQVEGDGENVNWFRVAGEPQQVAVIGNQLCLS